VGRLDRLVAAAKPAHIPHTIEVKGSGGTRTREAKPPKT
jgi:hypothetical protein